MKSGDELQSECVASGAPDAGPDGMPADGAIATACDTSKPFAPAVEVPGIHTSGANDVHAALTDDELTIYFASDRADPAAGRMHIYSATRSSVASPFATPTLVGALFSDLGESNPSVAPDGNTIYFDSYRLSQGVVHIFTSTRANAAVEFSVPTEIEGVFLSTPSITADGNVLYAVSLESGELARLDRIGAGFGPVQRVALETTTSMTSPTSRDDLSLFMSPMNSGQVLLTRRPSTSVPFPTPAPLSELSASAGIAEPSWLSRDGCRLYLRYQAAGEKSRLYVAARRE